MQNIGEECTMYPYTETETPLPILSPCVSVREYRGECPQGEGVETTERLKKSNSNNRVSYSLPAVSRSLTGCFVMQNIVEVSRSDGGVRK